MTLRTALIIDGDSAGGQKALADLNRSIAQTEQQTAKMGASTGAAATQAAASAQTAAAAVSRQGASYTVLTGAVAGNTVAMRESLVVSRELLNGNLTRLPGSLSILAQQFAISGKGATDFAKELLNAYGIIKISQDAELAASAASAAGTASVIAAEAKRAQSAIVAADAEVLLAEAALRNAEGSVAEAAAQTRLVAAHQAVATAAAEAAIAEEALAVAAGSAGEAAAVAGAAETVGLGAVAIGLAAVALVAYPVIEAFKEIKAELDKEKLDDFARSMHLTASEAAGLNDNVVKLVDKLEKGAAAARDAATAQQIFSQTAEGSIDTIKKLTDEIDKQNRTLQDNINLKKSSIGIALLGAESNQGTTRQSLGDAIAELRDAQASLNDIEKSGNVDPSEGATLTVAQDRWEKAKANVEDLTKKLHGLNDAVASGTKALSTIDFPLTEQRAKDAVDPISAINHQFDQMASDAQKAGTYTQAFADKLERQRKAAIDTAQANERLAKSTGEVGRQISFADAASIAKGAGLTVTSGYRSEAKQAELYRTVRTAANPVALPGTSAHEGVKGKWALDIAFAPGLTAQSLKKLYGDQGVALSAVYKESGHFHIEGSRSQAAAGDRAADRAAEQERSREAAFVQEKDAAEQQVIAARKSLATSAEQVWGFEVAAAIAAHQKTDDLIAAQQAAGKLLPQEATELKKINDEHEKYAQQLADQHLRQAQFAAANDNYQRGVDYQTGTYEAEREVLESQKGLAQTAGERRAIEQRLIDLQFTEERLKEQYIIDWAARVAANKDATDKEKADAVLAAQIAQMHLDSIPQRQGNATQGNNQTNASPLDAWGQQIPQTAKGIGDALESEAVKGINDFNDGLAEAIVKGKSLKDVFHSLAEQILQDLIKLALQEAELAILKQIFGASFGVPARAAGGPVSGGDMYLVGEKGPELFVPSANGTIVPNHKLQSGGMTAANNAGPSVSVTINGDFRNSDAAAVGAIQTQLEQIRRELPGQVVQIIREARGRFVQV